jgi:tripartite-type tricarboxylate transporter receptor subunit TctC
MTDLMGGHIDGGCDAPPSSSAPAQAGHIRAIAVMGAERAAAMPNVPTTVEQHIPELQAPAWVGLFAPKATPRPVLDALEKAVTQALADPEVQAQVTRLGANVPEPGQRGSKYADKFVPAEITKWADLAKAANIVKQ